VNASTVAGEIRLPAPAFARSNCTSNRGPSRVYFQSSSFSVGNPRIIAHSADWWRAWVSQVVPRPPYGRPMRESSSATVEIAPALPAGVDMAVEVTVVTALHLPVPAGLISTRVRDRRSHALRVRAPGACHPSGQSDLRP